MVRRSRQHTSDEFGRTGLGSAAAIGDRALGTAPGVIVDGQVEAERGVTPGPGPSGRTVVFGFAGLVLVSVALLAVFTALSAPKTLPVGTHREVWVGAASPHPRDTDLKLQLMPDVAGDEETPVWAARIDDRTTIVIDGRTVDAAALIEHVGAGMVQADVTSAEEGVISRIEIVTPEATYD